MHNILRPQYDIYEDYIKYYLQNISYRKHCPCSGNRSFVYSIVPSPTVQREKKAMTDLEYEVSLGVSLSFSTFLRFAASWTGVDKNIRTCITVFKVVGTNV